MSIRYHYLSIPLSLRREPRLLPLPPTLCVFWHRGELEIHVFEFIVDGRPTRQCLLRRLGLDTSPVNRTGRRLLRRHQGPVPLCLLEPQRNKHRHDEDPVYVVGYDGTISRRISPSKDGIEDTPATAAIELGAAAIHMPHRLGDIITSCTDAQFGSITSNDVVPLLLFKIPNSSGEKPGSDEVQKACGGN